VVTKKLKQSTKQPCAGGVVGMPNLGLRLSYVESLMDNGEKNQCIEEEEDSNSEIKFWQLSVACFNLEANSPLI